MDNDTIVALFSRRNKGLTSLQTEKQQNGQSSSSSCRSSARIMKKTTSEENVDSDTASTVDTDYSSDSTPTTPSSPDFEVEHYLHEVARSPRRLSLSDAKIALSYVQGKIKHDAVTHDRDGQSKIVSTLKHHEPDSKTYSSFRRQEKSVVNHKIDLLKNDSKKAFNIYSSNVDFVERPVSISMIEDTQAAEVVPANGDNRCQERRARSSKVMFPSLPPTKPPPLQLHTSVSRKYTGSFRRLRSLPSNLNDDDISIVTRVEKDDDISNVTHVEIANMRSVVVDLENSNDCCDLLSHGT